MLWTDCGINRSLSTSIDRTKLFLLQRKQELYYQSVQDRTKKEEKEKKNKKKEQQEHHDHDHGGRCSSNNKGVVVGGRKRTTTTIGSTDDGILHDDEDEYYDDELVVDEYQQQDNLVVSKRHSTSVVTSSSSSSSTMMSSSQTNTTTAVAAAAAAGDGRCAPRRRWSDCSCTIHDYDSQYDANFFHDVLLEYDDAGQLLIHSICKCPNASYDVIQYLIDCCPQSLHIRDQKTGALPLHYACAYIHTKKTSHVSNTSSSRNIMTMNGNNKNSNNDSNNNSIAYEIIQYMISQYPNSVACIDKNENLPLHRALCNANTCYDIIKLLIGRNVSALKKSCGNFGYIPLHIALQRTYVGGGIHTTTNTTTQGARIGNNNPTTGRGGVASRTSSSSSSSNESNRILQLLLDRSPKECLTIVDKSKSVPLHYAVKRNNVSIDILRYMISNSPESVYRCDIRRELPLHYAMRKHVHFDVTQLLINHSIDCLAWSFGKYQQYPIHTAIQLGTSINVVKLLIERYPECLEKADIHGKLPLHSACEDSPNNIDLDILELLIEQYPGALGIEDNMGRIPIVVAFDMTRTTRRRPSLSLQQPPPPTTTTAVRLRYQQQQQPHQQPYHHHQHSRRNFIAAATADTDRYEDQIRRTGIVMYLMNRIPLQLQHRNKDGLLPIHFATSSINNVNINIISEMIQRYPESLYKCDRYTGDIVLHYAIRKHASYDTIRLLLDRSSMMTWYTMKNHHGYTPIHEAIISMADYEIVQLLIERSTSCCSLSSTTSVLLDVDKQGRTPLHHAVMMQHSSSSSSSSSAGSTSCIGTTSYYFPTTTTTTKTDHIVKFLIDIEPKACTIYDHDGNLPIHCATTSHKVSLDVISLLVERYPDSVYDSKNTMTTTTLYGKEDNNSNNNNKKKKERKSSNNNNNGHDYDDDHRDNNTHHVPLYIASEYNQSINVLYYLCRRSPELLNMVRQH